MSQVQNDVRHLLEHIQKLPTLPSLVVEILRSFDDENIDVSTLAHKIACDQAIAARVLRVANSPFFGLSGQIGSIPEAVAVLGINNLRGLVTGAALINAFPQAEGMFDWKRFWLHSIDTAACAKVLARYLCSNTETAFTAGLLHDIGKLVMGAFFPEAFIKVMGYEEECTPERLAAEREALGFDHAALGAEVAARWRFPVEIQQAIAGHHTVQERGAKASLVDIVYVANLMTHARIEDRIREDKTAILAELLSARLGLQRGVLDSLAQETHQLYTSAVTLIG